MQKKWLAIFLMLLILFAGTMLLLAKNESVQARIRAADFSRQSQGGMYTLYSSTPTKTIEQQSSIRPSGTQPLQGGMYTLNTIHDSQVEQAVTAVISHTHSINPGAFLYDQDSTDIQMTIYYGLRWVANSTERAGFYMERPPDWDGQSPIKARITFAVGDGNAGTINWRLRLNHYTPHSGEWLTNPAAQNADQILNFASGSSLRIYDQTFTLQPQDFNDEPYWSFFFVRGDGTNGETYPAILYVMGVDVTYQTVSGTNLIFLPFITR